MENEIESKPTFKVTDKDGDINMKASERTRSHLVSPGNNHAKFGSPEEMTERMEKTFGNENKDEVEADKAKGFDINDVESIKAFKVGYTPVGNSLLVKFINEEQKIGSILIPAKNNSPEFKKAIVVVAGLYVNNLKTGDIVTLKAMDKFNPLPPSVDRNLCGVKFKEIAYEAIAGAFVEREQLINRIAEENKLLKGEQ